MTEYYNVYFDGTRYAIHQSDRNRLGSYFRLTKGGRLMYVFAVFVRNIDAVRYVNRENEDNA